MEAEINIERLLILQDALLQKNWSSESDVINYVNKVYGTKLTKDDMAEINRLIAITSNQMKHNYPLRCFFNKNVEI